MQTDEVRVFHKEGQLVPPGKLLLLMYTYNSDGMVTWCRHQVISEEEFDETTTVREAEDTATRKSRV